MHMPSGTIPPLTVRQRAVMERKCRIPIKVIAIELGVSETRINQSVCCAIAQDADG
jgi:hypothetical protein